MPKDPFKDFKKQINNATKTIEKGINKAAAKAQTTIVTPIRQEANKLATQSAPLIAQANRKVSEAVIKPVEKATQVVNQLAKEVKPIIAQSSQKITEPNKVKPKKSAGIKFKLPPNKPKPKFKKNTKETQKSVAKEEFTNITPVLPNIKTLEAPKTKTISNTTLGVMVTGGVALGVVGALFAEFSTAAGFISNLASGVIAGSITGGVAAIATEVMGGSPKLEQAVENAKKITAEYTNKMLRSKYAQRIKTTLIKVGFTLAKQELNNPATQKVIKDEIHKEVKKIVKSTTNKLEQQFYQAPTEQIKATAKQFGKMLITKPRAIKYKKTTTTINNNKAGNNLNTR